MVELGVGYSPFAGSISQAIKRAASERRFKVETAGADSGQQRPPE